MRTAHVYLHGNLAGILKELEAGRQYQFRYLDDYHGPPVSLAMPVRHSPFEFSRFPPFFDGVLPEGAMLEGLLRQRKIDEHDCFSQLIAVGQELVGAVTVEEQK
jgi:serine/threonine-protein kinase HipA